MTSDDGDRNWAPDDLFEWPADAAAGAIHTPQELVQTCRDYLLLVANRNLDRELQGKLGASDLVQETFVRAQRHFDQFRGRSIEEFLTWLRQILLNHLVDETRRYRDAAKRQICRERPLSQNIDSNWRGTVVSSDEKSPSSVAIEREEFAALAAAMEGLSAEYREVIQLRTWDRLPFAEVGRRMGRSTEAARKLWARAIVRLERELQ